MGIRPDLNVRIVVEEDHRGHRINARNSVIYSVDGETLILGQTEPSIESSMLDKEVVVTYLEKVDDKQVRYGFSALVTELVDRYELGPKRHVPAVMARKCAEEKPYDMRMCYRVGPSSKSGLEAAIYDEKVNVIDISLGGVKFS